MHRGTLLPFEDGVIGTSQHLTGCEQSAGTRKDWTSAQNAENQRPSTQGPRCLTCSHR